MEEANDFLGDSKENSHNSAYPQAEIPLSALKEDIGKSEESMSHSSNYKARPLSNLAKLFKTKELLRERKSKSITFSKPIVLREDIPIIFPNTINLIQGQAGVHKSRFGELLMSVILKKPNYENELLGFEAHIEKPYTGIYMDTERNLTEQFPYALQQIQINAGYNVGDEPHNFDYISLLEIERKERFATLREYLENVRIKHNNHFFIVLDVVTDCIEDFNRTDDSMQLTDMLNMAINTFNVTFLCIIHENPSANNKARGHLGTELMNKSSTVMQVGFEKNTDGSETSIIRLKFLKCRSTERPEPIYVVFDKEEKRLVLADDSEVSSVFENRKSKAHESDVVDHLEQMITFPIAKSDLVKDLAEWLSSSERTVTDRLESIIANQKVIYKEGKPFTLDKSKEGKKIIYIIKPIEEHESKE
jgi:hypothetical protein